MIIEQYTDMAGKIRIQWQSQATGNVYLYKFSTEPSQEELQVLSDASDTDAEISQPLDLSLLSDNAIIAQFIDKIKASPSITLAQYNTYLSALPWHQGAAIRNFVFLMAKQLSDRNEVSLSGWTEGVVLREVRDYIVDTATEILYRLIFNKNE